MININEILNFYPNTHRPFKRQILREFLQYKILNIIFSTEYVNKLSFMGGTCLKIIFGTNRFSEDLDFDNFGMSYDEFKRLSSIISKSLELEGYNVEIKNINKGAFRCYIRIPGILFDNNLSGYKEEKILIQLDSESQYFNYLPETYILNKFDIITKIYYTPKDVLLSQKIWAILNRKTLKGRDFYDSMYLFSITKPNYEYLKLKASINNIEELKKRINIRIKDLNTNILIKDISPFLININESKRIELFKEFVNNLK